MTYPHLCRMYWQKMWCVDCKTTQLTLHNCITMTAIQEVVVWHLCACVCLLYCIYTGWFSSSRGGAGHWVARGRWRGDQNKHSWHGVASCCTVAIYSAPDLCQHLFINLQAASAKPEHARWLGKYLEEQRRQYLSTGDIKELLYLQGGTKPSRRHPHCIRHL